MVCRVEAQTEVAGFAGIGLARREATDDGRPAGTENGIGMQEEEPGGTAGFGARRELRATTGNGRDHDRGAGLACEGDRLVA